MATIKFTLKLWINKKANRVVFAEASKDFVDFLLSLLTLPIGSVIKLSTKSKMLGCIGNVHQSVENLSNTYFLQADKSKELLSNPKVAFASSSFNVPVLTTDDVLSSRAWYSCKDHPSSVVFTTEPDFCPAYRCKMSTTSTDVRFAFNPAAISIGENGYVKEAVSYMVMDDLSIKPLSTVSLTTLFTVENVNSLEEREVDLGMEESNTALSEVFLVKKENK